MERPKVKLVGEDGNAFSILGRCLGAARHAGWTKEECDTFQKEATTGDYDHLLQTVMKYFDEPEDDEERCSKCGERQDECNCHAEDYANDDTEDEEE